MQQRTQLVCFETGVPGGLTALKIAEQLRLNTAPGFRGVADWLDLLTSLDTLQRTGE